MKKCVGNDFANRMNNVKPSAIRELMKVTKQPGVISFAGGWPAPELFPAKEMEKVCQKVLEEDGASALQYGPTEGYQPLREFIAERMQGKGIDVTADNIFITSGSQQGLEYSAKLYVNEGDVIICESPTYVGAIGAFNPYLPKYVEVAMDENGMIIEELEKALKENPNAKFIYTIPDFQNPTGVTMSADRREKLVELASKYGVPVVEDSPYGEVRFEGEKLPPIKYYDKEGIVIHLGTFSKTFCPGLRVGWVAANPDIIRKYVLIKQGADLQVNSMAQREIATFAKMYDYDAHVNNIIKSYKSRRDAMLNTMKEEFPDNIKFTYPKGGLFTWVELPEDVKAMDVFEKAIDAKVAFVPGDSFFPNGGDKNHFRLNYATMNEEKIIEGIKRLAKVLKDL
ncbi:aminotransferase-like domain-containing protein [Clostridium sp. Cult2]|uniref:aminotransferase-like domain-containing protein n=1 Tax=Clostridium sp. Cult2 TaxID=2079003 RepID=UPI001F38B131|nr:PLP-dependent aminotransferase family protein [Clostridium sp. Cult2]MCF6465566.1 aminotransferase [Clostridium sp. Cult2]